MILYEHDETGACVDVFEADPDNVVGSWLEHMNQEINRMVDRVNADCILDYWSRQDPTYINHLAPMMCYMECEHHGPQIGSRGDYPHPGTNPKSYCPECSKDLRFAIRNRMLTTQQLETQALSQQEIDSILAQARNNRAKEDQAKKEKIKEEKIKMGPPKMTPAQAATIVEYLQRQESILGHDNEAYRLHSGANFVLRTLGYSREWLEWKARQATPKNELDLF